MAVIEFALKIGKGSTESTSFFAITKLNTLCIGRPEHPATPCQDCIGIQVVEFVERQFPNLAGYDLFHSGHSTRINVSPMR